MKSKRFVIPLVLIVAVGCEETGDKKDDTGDPNISVDDTDANTADTDDTDTMDTDVGDTDDTDTTPPGPMITFVKPPPKKVKGDVAFDATWEITGGKVVAHTNMHACPLDRPDCEPPLRQDSDIMKGKAGQYTGSLTLAGGPWVVTAHANVDKTDIHSEDAHTEASGVGVYWVTAPQETLKGGAELTATWLVYGGKVVDHTNLHACPDPEEPDCVPPLRQDSVEESGKPGDYSGGILGLHGGDWEIEAHASVDGVSYHSTPATVQSDGSAIYWTMAPDENIAGGDDVIAAWLIRGGKAVEHTNLHACPETDPGCLPPLRQDSLDQVGKPGEYIGGLNTLAGGAWTLNAHAVVDGVSLDSTLATSVAGGVGVYWLQYIPDPLAANVDFSVAYRVMGGSYVDHTHLHACPSIMPGCLPPIRQESGVQVGKPGDFLSDPMQLGVGDWLIEAHANVGGQSYYSTEVEITSE